MNDDEWLAKNWTYVTKLAGVIYEQEKRFIPRCSQAYGLLESYIENNNLRLSFLNYRNKYHKYVVIIIGKLMEVEKGSK